MTADETQPTLSPTLLTTEKDMLVRAVEKWLKFQTAMWTHINQKLEVNIRRESTISLLFRLTIITLAGTITTISSIGAVPRAIVAVISGILTILTGIEAYLKLHDRMNDAKKQQREIEALRDKLRYQWFVSVEIEPEMDKRLAAAKRLLEDGPKAYNEILNNYSLKGDKGQAPTVNTGGPA